MITVYSGIDFLNKFLDEYPCIILWHDRNGIIADFRDVDGLFFGEVKLPEEGGRDRWRQRIEAYLKTQNL